MKTQTVLILIGVAVGGYIFYDKFLSTPTPLLTSNGATVAKPTGTSTGTTSFLSNVASGVNVFSAAGNAISGLFGGSSGDISSPNLPTQQPIVGGADQNVYAPDVTTGGADTTYTPDAGDTDFFDALGGNG